MQWSSCRTTAIKDNRLRGSKNIFMAVTWNAIRQKLCRLGWDPKQREIEGPGGEKVWVVFSNRAGRSFSIQAGTQQEAWDSAWRLVGKIQTRLDEPRMILPFPGSNPWHHRAA
jgi:hypothetical protein